MVTVARPRTVERSTRAVGRASACPAATALAGTPSGVAPPAATTPGAGAGAGKSAGTWVSGVVTRLFGPAVVAKLTEARQRFLRLAGLTERPLRLRELVDRHFIGGIHGHRLFEMRNALRGLARGY